jgi:hypothetical protein
VNQLPTKLLGDLTRQIRGMTANRPDARRSKLDEARQITEIISLQKRMNVSPEEYKPYRDHLIGGRVALLGLPAKPALVDWNKVIFKQLAIRAFMGARCSRPGTR